MRASAERGAEAGIVSGDFSLEPPMDADEREWWGGAEILVKMAFPKGGDWTVSR